MNVTLIGMPGAGKSTIGRALAEHLGYQFVDTDELMERKSARPLHRILTELGVQGFLELERRTVLGLTISPSMVIAPGGSVVYAQDAMDFLRRNSVVVYVKVPLGLLLSRVTSPHTRGIIGLEQKSLSELLEERTPLYRRYADLVVDVSQCLTVETVVRIMAEEVSGVQPAESRASKSIPSVGEHGDTKP